MYHELKTWPEYFQAVECGKKPFELRKNDRNYQADDLLILKEFDPAAQDYTGRWAICRVTYVLHGPGFGLEADHVCMGISLFQEKPATSGGSEP